jgi:hypothetical protein
MPITTMPITTMPITTMPTTAMPTKNGTLAGDSMRDGFFEQSSAHGSGPDFAPGVRATRARYRCTGSIMVLAFKDNHEAAVRIQPGQIFELVGPAEDDRFVVVNVKGEEFLVFNSDLEGHGTMVPERNVKTAGQPVAIAAAG